MQMIRGLIEGSFVVSYSMSCLSIVLYFSIVYFEQSRNDFIFKEKFDARIYAPIFMVLLPHIMAMIEYQVDTISIEDYKNWGNLSISLGIWPFAMIIAAVYIYVNYFTQKFIYDNQGYLLVPIFDYSSDPYAQFNAFWFIVIQMAVYNCVTAIGKSKLRYLSYWDNVWGKLLIISVINQTFKFTKLLLKIESTDMCSVSAKLKPIITKIFSVGILNIDW